MKKPADKLGPRARRILLRDLQHAAAHQIVSEWRDKVSRQGRQNARQAIAGFRRETGR